MDETHALKKVMEIAKNVGRLEQVLDQKTARIAALEAELAEANALLDEVEVWLGEPFSTRSYACLLNILAKRREVE